MGARTLRRELLRQAGPAARPLSVPTDWLTYSEKVALTYLLQSTCLPTYLEKGERRAKRAAGSAGGGRVELAQAAGSDRSPPALPPRPSVPPALWMISWRATTHCGQRRRLITEELHAFSLEAQALSRAGAGALL